MMTSTYRIQLHEEFTFNQLEEIIPYLHDMGISTIYASPVTRAIKGSRHGYDVTDPLQINPEIGTEQQMEKVSNLLQKLKMTWIQDLVPNHMAFETSNPWIWDMLEKGKDSPYYSFFDIEPDSAELLDNKIMVPFLGNTLTECLQKHEIRLKHTGQCFVISYFQQEYPINTASYKWMTTILPDYPPSLLENYFNEHTSLLKELLDSQHYVLTHAHLAASRINYRRFFTVNSLICLRMEEQKVFETYHRQILCWYKKGYIQGLRLDHIDGLANPRQYIERLRQAAGEDAYIVAEKILAADESLPPDWQLQGTTGYDFLAMADQLFTDPDGFYQLKRFYLDKIVPNMPPYKDLVFEKKIHFLQTYMGGELNNLVHRAGVTASERDQYKKDLASFMSSLPVYRYYPETKPEARIMQFTGPLAAKGIEDTVFYIYNPLIARNEVGDSPSIDGLTTMEFHQKMILRQQTSPLTMNAGTTHDTKRGEDARIRLCWLSAIPNEWVATVTRWREFNKHLIQKENGRPAPSPNDEYFIYQSLIGSFPPDMVVTAEYRQRFHEMLTKALREAKTNTSWDAPDEAYEKKCHAFVDALLDTESHFMEDFFPFVFKCIKQGARYSLAQLLLRLTAPGIPDIYQGSESWDLSFVDPDNRRPVDYEQHRQLLHTIKEEEKKGFPAVIQLLTLQQRKGIGKLYTIYKTLAYRNTYPEVFTKGEYIPIEVPGPHLAYMRHYRQDWVLIVIPLIRMTEGAKGLLSVSLPSGAPTTWTNLFTGDTAQSIGTTLRLDGLLEKFPIALLTAGTTADLSPE